MKVPATFDFPGPVLVADIASVVHDHSGGMPVVVIRKESPQAEHGDLFVGGVKVGEQAFVLKTEAERVYEAGDHEPVGLLIHQTTVGCVVDYGGGEDVPF